jgi:hypothetical protein
MRLTTKHLMRTRRLEKLISIQDRTNLDKCFMVCAFEWRSPNIREFEQDNEVRSRERKLAAGVWGEQSTLQASYGGKCDLS